MPPTASYLLLALIVILANVHLFKLYKPAVAREGSPAGKSWVDWLELSPSDLGGFSYWKLALASVAGLFLELLMIRWISSEIRVFAYFKNFVLISCFLGFGLGCYLCRHKIRLVALLAPLIVLAVVVNPWFSWHELLTWLPSMIGGLSEVDVRGVPSLPRTWTEISGLLETMAIVVPLFGLIAFTFHPIGQLVGWYLEKAPQGIKGYTVNILGSLAGIMLFTGMSFMNQPPATWFAAAGVLFVGLFWRPVRVRWMTVAVFLACVGLTLAVPSGDSRIYWSPYQKLTLTPEYSSGELITYHVRTNDTWYQQIFNLSPEFEASHPDLFRTDPPAWNPYNVPYRFFPNPDSVLVLGAGTGNDVAAALRSGAQRVVAVEIDPLIQKLGRDLHFEKPYSSPRTHVVINDARSYIENSQERFDVIMFSLLDSHTTSSYYTNIRIDNYVYTLEALLAAKKLLKPGGLLILKFWVDTPWITGRLKELTQAAFGQPPFEMVLHSQYYASGGTLFICGSEERIRARLAGDPELNDFVSKNPVHVTQQASLTTDDWPYFYQHEPGLPSAVIVMSLVLAMLGWLSLRQTGISIASLDWHFFFLGAGFLLLEAQIISKMALLFGTTWMVNSLVISGLLVLIVGANLLVHWKTDINIGVGYAGIFASILLSYFLPIERLFFASLWLKAVTATAVLCLPVFFAGIVFIKSFGKVGFRGEALGSNLFGALVGGLLESLSFWTGIHALLVLAAVLYTASLLAVLVPRPSPAPVALSAD